MSSNADQSPRHFTVCYADADAVTRAGFGKVAHLPFILDSRPGYHRLGSQYLIDRGLGVWAPQMGDLSPGSSENSSLVRRLTKQSLDSYAHWLSNFLEWAELRKVKLETCSYHSHIYGDYQSELDSGEWSRDGASLRPRTVNAYVGQACEFLLWMAAKGKRQSFHIPTISRSVKQDSARNASSHKGAIIQAREGKVRDHKRRLRMPNDEELKTWLHSLYVNLESPFGLMAETVLGSALRRAELTAFRVDTLPLDIKNWHISNPLAPETSQLVLVPITFGAKGPSYGSDNGDKVGPLRDINIPLHLAKKLHAYRELVRPRILHKRVKRAKGIAAQRKILADAVHLFLDPETGEKVPTWKFYDAWKSGKLPFPEWSPHLGRDWWACATLLQEVKSQEHLLKIGPDTPGALVAAAATDIIRLKIQPQLGHARVETCFIYLQWLTDMLGVALPEQYQRHLDQSDSNEDRR